MFPLGRPCGEKLMGKPSGPADKSGVPPAGGSMTMFSAAICANVEKSGVETKPHSANCAVPSGGAPTADPCHPLTGAVWREWSHSSDCLTSLAVQRHAVTAQVTFTTPAEKLAMMTPKSEISKTYSGC